MVINHIDAVTQGPPTFSLSACLSCILIPLHPWDIITILLWMDCAVECFPLAGAGPH